MTEEQKQEFLSFLKTKGPKETLHDHSFGILCLSYDTNRNRKMWITFDHPIDRPAFETILTVGDKKWPFLTLIGDVIKDLE